MIDHELQGQYEALDLENHRMRKAVAKLMARLTVWLDDDQFNEADGIMHPEFAPQCKPLATVPAAVDVGAAQAETAQAAPAWCSYCGGAGDVHSLDGEWRGECTECPVAIARTFKNFHANLCKRFGYAHDEKGWQRDLASLEEHIAKLAAQAAPTEQDIIAAFLERTGQYVTNDASREAAIADAVEQAFAAQAAQPAAEPDFWTACAWVEGGGEAGWIPLPGYSNETVHGVKNLVLEGARREGYKGTVTGRLMELGWEVRPVYLVPQPAPQAGAAEPALRPDIQAVLLELDVPVQGYLASHAGTFLKHAAMMPPEEYPVPLVRESDHRRACRKIAALVTHPTEQPSQDAERWQFVLEHAVSGKAPKDKGFDITYVPVGHNGSEWGRIEIEWRGAKWEHITADGVNAIIDAARAAQAQGESKGGAA